MSVQPIGGNDDTPLATTWKFEGNGRASNGMWEGYLWNLADSSGSTIAPAGYSTLAAGATPCASGTLAAAAGSNGWAEISMSIDRGVTLSTAPTLDGDFNEWTNGSIVYAAAEGLLASGNDGKASNNLVHDVDYMATSAGGIATQSSPALYQPASVEISGNTVFRTGCMGINLTGSNAGHALRNRVSQAMLMTDDGGLIYAWGTKGGGTEVAYNDVSDNQAIYGTGIYLDDGLSGFVVHHNLIRNTSWYGISFKAVNTILNNTILATPIDPGAVGMQMGGLNQWQDLSTAIFSNNLVEQRPGVFFVVQQQQTTDWADYQFIVPVTKDWQKVTVPFSSLRQPNYGIRESLDLTQITQLTWRLGPDGTYEIDLDDVWLEGPTPKLVDDFDAGSTNRFGGDWWGAGSSNVGAGGPTSTGTKSTVSGYTGNGIALTGNNIPDGSASLGTHLSSSGQTPVDLSAYTGISFRIRGTATLLLSDGSPSTTPIQQHNLDCPVDANGIPTSSCPVDQGGLFSPYTDGYAGAAPDVGAFESEKTPWTAGSTTFEPSDTCPQ